MKKHIVGILFLISLITVGQSIEKDWKFESIKNNSGVSLVNITPTDSFSIKDGEFNYSLLSKDSLVAKGTYINQNNILTLNYSSPKDTVRSYKIVDVTDSILTLSENETLYSFSAIKKSKEIATI